MSERPNWVYYGSVFPPSSARCKASVTGKEGNQTVVLSFFAYPDELTLYISPAQSKQLEQALSNVNRALADDEDDGLAPITEDDRKAELQREEREPAGDHE